MALYQQWQHLKSGGAPDEPEEIDKENEAPVINQNSEMDLAISQFKDKTQTVELKSDHIIKLLIENEVKK